MTAKIIYISGPMTGLPNLNRSAFNAVARMLRDYQHIVINPVEIGASLPADATWHDFMRADIAALCRADTLVLLPGWERSAGAQLELHIAHRLGLEIHTTALPLAPGPTQ